jgi:hypothetical protein
MSAQPEPEAISAPERLLRSDLEGAAFSAGVDRGYWRLISLQWPCALIAVAAAARPGSPESYVLRFDLSGYPEAPTAQLWNEGADTPLDISLWPGGGPRIIAAFNPTWKLDALYIPVDRVALDGHDGWLERYACHIWDASGDLTQYLRLVHGLLNDPSYTGPRG